jgi:hypothetical protein
MEELSDEDNEWRAWGLSPDHLWLLGSVAAGSAMLEQTLGSTLRSQLEIDTAISNILVSGMTLQ